MAPSPRPAMPQENWRFLSHQLPPAAHLHNRGDSIGSHHRTQISRWRVWVFVPWLDLPFDEQILDALIGKDRSLSADKAAVILTVPTEADSTFHIPFHGKID